MAAGFALISRPKIGHRSAIWSNISENCLNVTSLLILRICKDVGIILTSEYHFICLLCFQISVGIWKHYCGAGATLWPTNCQPHVMNLSDTVGLDAAATVAQLNIPHCSDVIMGAMGSQITSFTIVYTTVYSGADQRKHQSSASLPYVRGIHR